MFRYMPRAGYRSGEKRLDVWLTVAQHAHLRRIAAEMDCSLSDAVGRLVREKVNEDAGGTGSGDGRSAASDRSGPRDDPFADGEDHAGVDAGYVADEVVTFDDVIDPLMMLFGKEPPARLRLVGAEEPVLPFPASHRETMLS